MKRLITRLVMAGSLSLPLLALPLGAQAATFVVTRTDDPTPDGCATNGCSLREALIAANATAVADTIKLADHQYVLSRTGVGEEAASTGDLDITKPVIVDGIGPVITSINGGGIDRVFDVRPGAEKVMIADLEIINGNTPPGLDQDQGGAVRNAATLTLRDLLVVNNDAECCGGGVLNTGDLSVIETTIRANSVDPGGDGGGIDNDGGTLNLRDSIVRNNSATAGTGGGIANIRGGVATISNTEIIGNEAPGCCGGGIANVGDGSTLTVSGSNISNNTAEGCCGGAVLNEESERATITRSTIKHNSSSPDCCGGALYNENSTMIVSRSTLVGNETSCCGGAGLAIGGGTMRVKNSVVRLSRADSGGAFSARNLAHLVVSNTLIKDNSAEGDGGAIEIAQDGEVTVTASTLVDNSGVTGGGIFNDGSTLRMTNTTVTANSSSGTGGGLASDGGTNLLTHVTFSGNTTLQTGGGIGWEGGSFDVFRSIVANNRPDDCSAALVGVAGVNLDEDSTCFGAAAARHADPKLRPLTNNGGPTPTHALRPTSPALDGATAGSCPPPGKDQRGVKRPQDGDGNGSKRCDLGAFERKPG